MKTLKKYWLIIIIVAAILIGGIVFSQNQTRMILFYGDTCPHCKIVSDYIEANGIKDKLSFQELEVYHDQANVALMTRKAKQCGLDTSQGIGVPFFFDGQKCLVGDQPIIDYFKSKI